ncbi:M55 family metallopeptidase [Halovivax sp.]|uniref:M55 family metallopeptidase n=1 Tax=Halovivax sp. TaxID=1935978 RepID=UPI0025BF6BB2|nr:M55 family metallopeptidase [Halovivax sp.]
MSEFCAFVSADVEGVSGYGGEDDDEPEAGRAMVADVNAAVEGLLAAEPDATVTVADAHGSKLTVDPAALHDRASLVRGGPRPNGMVDGVPDDADLAVLVGFHDRPGTGGFLEHTFSGSLADVRLDGRSVGEVELDAALLGDLGVPVALVTGDDVLGETVAARLPAARYVATKSARGFAAARCRPPAEAREEIREAARDAAADPPKAVERPVPIDPPLRVAVDFVRAEYADVATLWPGVERGADSRTAVREAIDVTEAYRFVRGASKLSV